MLPTNMRWLPKTRPDAEKLPHDLKPPLARPGRRRGSRRVLPPRCVPDSDLAAALEPGAGGKATAVGAESGAPDLPGVAPDQRWSLRAVRRNELNPAAAHD